MTTIPATNSARHGETNAARITRHAARIIRVATGEDWGDGVIIHDLGVGIVDGPEDAVWVTGDWNDRTTYDHESGIRTTIDDTPSRLLAALERVGVDCWWFDTCSRCTECDRLVDTEPTYGAPPAVWVDDAGYVCAECVSADLGDYLGDYLCDSDKALPDAIDTDALTGLGFQEYGDGYASGWHGRQDSPADVAAEITSEHPGAEYVFQVTGAHQFELSFTAWYRVPGDDEL